MFAAKTVKETCAVLECSEREGLAGEEAVRRLSVHGPNVLREERKKSPAEIFLEQLCDPLIYVLLAAGAVSLMLRERSDAAIIFSVVALNAFVGTVQEGRAKKALDALKNLSWPMALVIRDGKEKQIRTSSLVPGDLTVLTAGCQVPADLRLVKTDNLWAEESALTGEAVPIMKNAAFLADEKKGPLPLGDRQNMAYMSTVITEGRGLGIVTATGMETQIGQIAAMITENREEATPLQKRLGELGKMLSFLSVGICAVLFAIGLLQKREPFEMLLTAISLAVAAVPEGLPAVVTLCLAMSVTRMAKVNTIIRRLPCVETLGAVNVVCSDKTGTLTQNRMTVTVCYADGREQGADALNGEELQDFLTGMALCSDAVLEDAQQPIGEPTELALASLAAAYGFSRNRLEKSMPRTKELPFSAERKMMTTWHGAQRVSYTKGAPDRVLPRCTHILKKGKSCPMTLQDRERIEAEERRLNAQALRTLAYAKREDADGPVEEGLIFLGLAGMQDPIRPEAAGAVESFARAGVATVMITGDHAETAFAIGKQLGIVRRREQCLAGEELDALSEAQLEKRLEEVRVFARVSPADKVRIVRGFRAKGCVVAMTGDGVNDAPALKAADVGVAMGKNGTDVARGAADLVLTDDNFATIEKAMREGRGVYENIRKSVIFLLSSNLGELLTMFTAVLLGLAAPLRSVHILWINLITDSLPALALGTDRNDTAALMEQPPRDVRESLFARGGLAGTLFYGILIAGISLAAWFFVPWTLLRQQGVGFSLSGAAALLEKSEVLYRAQTYAFTVLGMSQLIHAVGMRNVSKSVFRLNPLENRLMIAALLLGFSLQFLVTEIPFLVDAFSTVRLSISEWMFLSGLSLFPLLAHELLVWLGGMRKAGISEGDRQYIRV